MKVHAYIIYCIVYTWNQKRMPKSGGCWDWQSTASFFEDTLAGKRCDRNWLEGEMGSRSDRLFRSPSPALLGFDETIVELCSRLIGADPWGGQDKLDFRVADRCLRARRNGAAHVHPQAHGIPT